MKKISVLFSALAVMSMSLFNVACGSDSNDGPEGDEIKLEASKLVIANDGVDFVTFTVKSGNDDVTSKAVIKQKDGAVVEDAKFSATEEKEYIFVATYEGKTSNEVKITASPASAESLELSADKTTIFVNTTATFTVKHEGVVTHNAVIKNKATGEEIVPVGEKQAFTPSETGEYVFIAELSGETSNELTIKVVEEGTTFLRKTAFFRLTGINCSNCPTMAKVVKEISEEYPNNFVNVSIYGYERTEPFCLKDEIDTWETFLKYKGGYPFGNFELQWTYSGGSNAHKAKIIEKLDEQLSYSPATTGFDVTPTLDGKNLEVSVKVKASEAGEYTLGVMLMESDIVYRQTGGGQSYVHNNVLRKTLSGAGAGTELGAMTAEQEVTKTYTFTFNDDIKIENCKLMLFTTYVEDGVRMIDNATYASISENTPYEYEIAE